MSDPERLAAEPTENDGGTKRAIADPTLDEPEDAAAAEPTENDGGTKAQ